MVSRKRTASEALLPIRAPKHARMTVDRSDTQPGVHASPSNAEGLIARWIALTKETFKYALGLSDEMPPPAEAPAHPSPPPARPRNPSPPQHTLPPRAPIPHFDFTSTPHHPPTRPSALPPPPPRQNGYLHTHTRSSVSMTPGPSSVATDSTTPYDELQAALARMRCQNNRLENGVTRKYRRKDHIHAKLHKAKVKEELQKKLFELEQAKGYQSDFTTFQGYLAYRQRILDLQKQESTSPASSLPGRSKTPNTLFDPVDGLFLEKAIQKARKTFDSPKPPKPFVPNFEQLRISTRAKDAAIDQRLHPKRAPHPDRLPEAAQAEVHALLRKTGILSKCVKEQVTDQDLRRLGPGQWLNDEIINFYGQLIMNRSMEAEAAKENGETSFLSVHYFSTFFWLKLKMGYEKGRLAKWTKKIDIFSKDVILIPVNHNNAHWTAAAINFRQKRIEAYDSMGVCRDEVFKALRMYVDEEHKNKKKKPFDFTGWENFIHEDIPQQENGFDCGVFTCQFLEALSRGEEEFNFSQRDMPYLRQRMMWEIGRARLDDVP